MAVSGPEILASDLANDTYNLVLDLYDAELSVPEIYIRVSELEKSFLDVMDLEIYLAASTKAYWEIGHLDPSHIKRLVEIRESGRSAEMWRETGDILLAELRVKALNRLVRQCLTPRLKPRARKKYPKITNNFFEVGDCLELAGDAIAYQGVVCEILDYRGRHVYALLLMNTQSKSTEYSFTEGHYFGHCVPHHQEGQDYKLDPLASTNYMLLRSIDQAFLFGPHVVLLDHKMLIRAGQSFKKVARISLDVDKITLGSYTGSPQDMSGVFKQLEKIRSIAIQNGNVDKHLCAREKELLPICEILK